MYELLNFFNISVTVRIVFNKDTVLMGNLTGLPMVVGRHALSDKLGVGMRTVVVVTLCYEQVADLPIRMVEDFYANNLMVRMLMVRVHFLHHLF